MRALRVEHSRLPPTSVLERSHSEEQDVERVHDARDAGAVVAELHGLLGNEVVASVIAGAGVGGLEVAIGGAIGGALVGMGPGATGMFTSNQAMLRLMRSAGPVHDLISAGPSRTGGVPLPAEVRAEMEAVFHRDLSAVRVHTGGLAERDARDLNAHAFAIGEDLWFGAGAWAPGTERGDALLVHELTHVVQHQQGRLAPRADGREVSLPSDPTEREAYANEARLAPALEAIRGSEDQPADSLDSLGDTSDTFGVTGGQSLSGDTSGVTAAESEGGAGTVLPQRAAARELDAARVSDWIARSAGVALPPAVASRLASVLGQELPTVTVHTDAAAARAAADVGAHAFTVGTHVYFGEGEYAPGTAAGDALLAHELTHVTQHVEGRVPSAAEGLEVASPSHTLEQEAERAAAEAGPALDASRTAPEWSDTLQLGLELSAWGAATAWGALEVAKGGEHAAPEGPIQPSLLGDLGNVASGAWNAVTDTASAAAGAVADLGASALEALVRRVSPGLADLIAQGPAAVIQGYVERAVGSFLGTVFGGASLGDIVGTIQGAIGGALGVIAGAANGDTGCCSAFTGWMEGLTGFVEDVIHNPVFETMRGLLVGVNDAMAKVLGLVVGPAFDLLRDLLGGAWTLVSGFAETISGWVDTVRSVASQAWDWVAEKLGLGGGGEGGITEWFTNLASQAWDTIKETFAPLMGPLQTIGTVMAALTPFGQIYLLYTAGQEVWRVGSWLFDHWGDPDLIEKAHEELGDGMLPQLVELMLGFGEQAKGALQWLADGLGSLASGVVDVLSAITGIPLLSVLSGVVETLSTQATALASWASSTLTELGTTIATMASDLWEWAQPIIEVCTSIALCILNPGMIPVVLAGWAWEALPDCFKAAIIDFLLDVIILALEASPDLPMFGPLWVAIKPGVLGFLRNIRGQDTETKVTISNKFARIVRGSSLGFIFGFVKGFLKGIWEGITDPFVMAWQLLTGLGSLAGWVMDLARGVVMPDTGVPTGAPAGQPARTEAAPAAEGTAQTGPSGQPTAQQAIADKARAMWAELGPQVSSVGDNFMPAVREYFSGDGMDFNGLMERLGELWPQLQSAIEGLGGTLAQELVAFLMQDSAESAMGEGVGWLTGTIVFEVVLFYFTAGAGTAMVEGSRILTWILRFLDWPGEALGLAFKGLAKLGGFLLDLVRGLGRLMSSAGSGAISAVMRGITSIGESLMRWGDELFGLAGRRADEVVERTTREVVEEGAERTTREVVEEGAERTTREVTEEAGERTTREATEEAGERTTREATEEAGERTTREATEEGGERTTREATEEGAEETVERGARTEATARQASEAADDFRRQADEVLETAPPLQQRVDQVTGVNKGAEYDEAQDQLREWYRQMEADARPVQVSGTRTDGPYGWNYGYEVTEFPHGVTEVRIKVHLQPGAGVTPADLARVEADARVGVDQYYNFQHTVTNSSGNPSRLHVEVEYVTDPTHAHLTVDVHGGAGHANLDNWYVDSAPTVHAHELGHQMGLVDEYVDPSVVNRATPAAPGVHNDQGLMSNFWTRDGAGNTVPHADTHLPQRNLDEIGADIRTHAPTTTPTTSATPPGPGRGAAPTAPTERSYVPATDKPRGMSMSDEAVREQFGQSGVDLMQSTTRRADEILASGASRNQRGPVLSGIYDTRTGQSYFGQNLTPAQLRDPEFMTRWRDDLHPLLRDRLDAHERALADNTISAPSLDIERAGVPGSHSEINALNQALQAREAAGLPVREEDLGDLLLHNRSLGRDSSGVPPRCINCWHITDGVRVIGND